MRTLQRMRRFVQNGYVHSKRPRVHPLRGMPRTVQVRRIEIGGANRAANECGGYAEQNQNEAAERQADTSLGRANRARVSRRKRMRRIRRAKLRQSSRAASEYVARLR